MRTRSWGPGSRAWHGHGSQGEHSRNANVHASGAQSRGSYAVFRAASNLPEKIFGNHVVVTLAVTLAVTMSVRNGC
jgi:hypothetical protein